MEGRTWRRFSRVMTSYLLFFNMHGYCKSRPSGQPPYYARNKSFPLLQAQVMICEQPYKAKSRGRGPTNRKLSMTYVADRCIV